MIKTILVAAGTAGIIAATTFTGTAVNNLRIADNNSRYVQQSVAAITERNRLDEKISRLTYQIPREKDPETKGYLKSLLDSAKRSLSRLENTRGEQ